MAAISQMPNSFRIPPAFIPGGNEISVNALRDCGDNQENPIEIESDTEDGSSSDGEDENDDDLPPVSDLLRRSVTSRDENVADGPQRANIATRHSSTRRLLTPPNDHNSYAAGMEAEGGAADNGSQGDLGKADGADGVQDTRLPQSAALPIEADGEQCEDKSGGNVDGEGFGMSGYCRQDGGGDSGAGGSGASDDATSAAGNHAISQSLQSPPFLDATHENRKRRQEPDGPLSNKRTKLAQQPDVIPPANCAFPSEQNHGGHCARDCDEEDGTEDDGRSHHLQAMRLDSCPSKQRKTGQALSRTATTTDYSRLQDAPLQYADTTVPREPRKDPVDTPNDESVSHRPSPALNGSNERDVTAVGDGSIVSVHQASSSKDKYDDIDRDGQGVHHPQNDRRPEQSLGSKSDSEDGRIRRCRSGRRSSYSARRPAREGEGDQRISRRTKQNCTVRLNGSDGSGDELERLTPRRSSRLLRRRRVDTVSRDKDKHRVAGRLLPGLLHRPSNDPDPANPRLEVRGHDGEMQLDGSDKHPQTAPARVTHVTRVTIRPISRDASVLIALGRGDAVQTRYDDGVASAIEDAVGHAVKLVSISIDPLPSRAWLLTGLVRGPDEDGDMRTGDGQVTALRPQPRPQSSSICSGSEGQQSSDGNDSSSDGSDGGGDASSNWLRSSQERGGNGRNGKNDEGSDGLGDSVWKSRHTKGSRWAESEDEHLRGWVTLDARPEWKAICRRFLRRTDASVYLRGHKIRSEERAERRKQGG